MIRPFVFEEFRHPRRPSGADPAEAGQTRSDPRRHAQELLSTRATFRVPDSY
jgi:hypothetical protein